MKNRLVATIFFLFAGAISASTQTSPNRTGAADRAVVGVCDVSSNPGRFMGKPISIEGIFKESFEGNTLFELDSGQCKDYLEVELACAGLTQCKQMQDQIHSAIAEDNIMDGNFLQIRAIGVVQPTSQGKGNRAGALIFHVQKILKTATLTKTQSEKLFGHPR